RSSMRKLPVSTIWPPVRTCQAKSRSAKGRTQMASRTRAASSVAIVGTRRRMSLLPLLGELHQTEKEAAEDHLRRQDHRREAPKYGPQGGGHVKRPQTRADPAHDEPDEQ